MDMCGAGGGEIPPCDIINTKVTINKDPKSKRNQNESQAAQDQ